jgi:hypothetical protein
MCSIVRVHASAQMQQLNVKILLGVSKLTYLQRTIPSPDAGLLLLIPTNETTYHANYT